MEILSSIILMGIKHCGKTTLGRRLAQSCRCEFIDLDAVIVKRFPQSGCTAREIYNAVGGDGFRQLERDAASFIGNADSRENRVISLGGGTVENPKAMKTLAKAGRFVYLQEAEDILFRRIMRKGIPPFLSDVDPEKSFHTLYVHRHTLYRQAADLIVHKKGTSVQDAFDMLVSNLEEAGYARK